MRVVVAISLGLLSALLLDAAPGYAASAKEKTQVVQVWASSSDGKQRLAKIDDIAMEPNPAGERIIHVDPAREFQAIEGFGASFTDASAWLIQNRLSAPQRKALLRELFDPKSGLGLSLTRMTIGASDFSQTHYSYNDMPEGQTDPQLKNFSIAPARKYVLPTIKQAMAVNRSLRVFASPWSAPAWMKTSGSMIKGKLAPEHYEAFGRYLHRTVKAFKADGVPIYALTIQNEPHFQPEDYPGMHMVPADRAAFVGRHLGPMLARDGSKVRILEWDHNWDRPHEPLAVLADPVAQKYLSGTAWHCYGGDVSAQSNVHDAFPEKETWFTECSGGDWAPDWGGSLQWMTQNLIIGTTRNWAKGVILWNLALDEKNGPHLGGCGNCRGVVTIDQATGAITRNVEYYVLGHASRFVKRGARRIESDTKIDGLETVAFQNPGNGSMILIAVNTASEDRQFSVVSGKTSFSTTLAAGSVKTFTWSAASQKQ